MESFKDLKFFVVDGDPFCRMLYCQHLLNLGFKDNIVFDNGLDCIEQLDLNPDIIFLGYDMEPQNGLEVLQKIKQTNPNIHLLIISGRRNEQLAKDALNIGAYDYIIKGDNDLELISKAIVNIASGSRQLTVAH